jgi:hypothetical protein
MTRTPHAFREEAAFPSADVGPVDFRLFARFAITRRLTLSSRPSTKTTAGSSVTTYGYSLAAT